MSETGTSIQERYLTHLNFPSRLMIGELFSSDVKGIAGSLTGTLNWSLAFVVTISYPTLSQSIGISACFLIFTALSVIGTIFSFFIVPETKGKSLKEIQDMLGEK